MVASLEEFAFGIIVNLVTDAVKKIVDVSVLKFFEQRKIESRVRDAVADVVEPLIPFLEQEKISQEKQERLLQTCVDELRPLAETPERLFAGSLNGQKIFDELYAKRPLPQVVIEDGVKDVYVLLCPRVAEVLCKISAAVKDWERLAWAENYRRLDDLVRELRILFDKVDAQGRKDENRADETLNRVRRSLTQKIGMEMDITDLRADHPQNGKLTDFFVHPAIQEIVAPNRKAQLELLANAANSLARFARPNQKNVIIGVGGAGKSTWSKWLEREALALDGVGFAVRKELHSCVNCPLPSVYDLAREAVGVHLAEELTTEVIARWLDRQAIIFILDGFDEVPPGKRDAVYEWIAGLCQTARGCPVVLTSRPLTTDHLERSSFDTRWNMEPFDEPRIVDYIERWYTNAPLLPDAERAVDAAKLASQWQDDPTLAPLTGNPLLLSTLLMVHYLDGRLPNGRSQLYRRYIDGMLGLWDDRRHLTGAVSLTLLQKKQVMRGLALHLFLQERDQLDEADVLAWLESFLNKKRISQSVGDVLNALRERSGLLIGPGVYTFAHKNIAEYLVAEVVLDGIQKDANGQRLDRMYLFEQRDNDRWNSALFFWAGMAPVADLVAFIDQCIGVKNWPLAYGLLYDQYDRIHDRETRRRLLLAFGNQKEPFENHWNRSYGTIIMRGVDGSPSFASTSERPIDFFFGSNLRGVTRNDYSALVYLALQSGALSLEDGFNMQEELVVHIWSEYLDIVKNDMGGLRKCLAVRCPFCQSDEDWFIYILNNLLTSAVYSKDGNLTVAIEMCHTLLPEYGGVLPLLLMSYCAGVLSCDVQKVLSVLPTCDRGKSYPTWLLGTRNWQYRMVSSHDDDGLIDLLNGFENKAKRLARRGDLPHDAAFERAMQYVDELRQQRAALAAQMGVDLGAGLYIPEEYRNQGAA